MEATLKNDAKFITMPPKATHLCQPLDVAVFRGLKATWKTILAKWRLQSPVKGAIPKGNLPTLLYQLQNSLKDPAGKRITEFPEKQNIAPKQNEPGRSNDRRKRKAEKSNQLVEDTITEEIW